MQFLSCVAGIAILIFVFIVTKKHYGLDVRQMVIHFLIAIAITWMLFMLEAI